jgi:hypothetical protein
MAYFLESQSGMNCALREWFDCLQKYFGKTEKIVLPE